MLRSATPLPKDSVDGTILTTYLYLRNEYIKKIKRPIFFSEHGVSVVKSGFRKDYHVRTDYMMQSGPMWEERTRYLAPKFKGSVRAGFPKSDELVNGKSTRSEVIREFDLDPKEPVIVYAPTWWHPDCYNPGSTVVLDEIESMGFKNLLVCFHDFDRIGETKAGKRYIRTPNKNRYLLAADLLIGDHSSIILEYAILNRPIVQVNAFKDFQYFYIWRDQDCGIFQIGDIAKPGGIKRAVEAALSDPKKWEFLRKYWVERTFYNLGSSSKAIADKIEEVLK